MSFDTATRNRLATFVGKCRALLCGDFKSPGGEMARQLAHYGIQDTGKNFEVDSLTHLDEPGRETARTLRSILAHKQANAPAAKVWKKFDAAVYDLIQEQGFTVLNRLCALRMAEERKILQFPCISKGLQSDGFELYEYHSGKANAAIAKEDRFQHFVFSLFDELSLDLGSLFDRFSPQGLLFPAPKALAELLDLINDPALAHLWAEDETIGWIYQYWNSKEERKAMRDASAAPRNSRELAVRNQFFTPRYVVQFLTDNTLGRIWYEMTKGRTDLVDQCQYLVRRPNEIFLAKGEAAPEVPSDQSSVISEEALTQEELLKQPVYIPHRPLKDPREIRLLDPACGSMHFGLYAFDLFEKIYSEFWDLTSSSSTDHSALITDHSHGSWIQAYASKAAFMLDVPKMIIEHNIHGIDIDPRAAQIAGLALWLRAQRSWQAAGLLATQRPKVERSNIVCAEPMPGDKEQLKAFTANLHPAIAKMVEAIFDKMQLAGEAGSLLKIEEEITSLVEGAKAAWKQIGKHEGEMFSNAELAKNDLRSGTQTQLDLGSWNLDTLSAISDRDFFEQAEQSIYQALSHYAESAGEGSYKRKLFAEDAAQGFAFIDLCRKRYDAVVMNPPFGEPSLESREYLYSRFDSSKKDIFAAFVDRGSEIGDSVGAITSRTCFFLSGFQDWRRRISTGEKRISAMADLADGVLDAMVEAAAYTIINGKQTSGAFFRATDSLEKGEIVLAGCKSLSKGERNKNTFLADFEGFRLIPSEPFAYWLTRSEAELFQRLDGLEPGWGSVIRGPEVPDLFQAARCWWEVDSYTMGQKKRWVWYAKGGEFKRFAHDVHLLVDYEGAITGSCPFRRPGDSNAYFKGGVTFTQRTSKPISFRVLPAGCLTSPKGPAILASKDEARLTLLGLVNSRLFSGLVDSRVGAAGAAARSYDLDILRRTPLPDIDSQLIEDSRAIVEAALTAGRSDNQLDETSPDFFSHNYGAESCDSLIKIHSLTAESAKKNQLTYDAARNGIETLFQRSSGLCDVGDVAETEQIAFLEQEKSVVALDLFSFLYGTVLARWDIRYATGERQAPELPDPFDPLPVCPPGMLQNESGLPLTNVELAELNAEGNYPLRITIEGILVDDPDHAEDIARRVRESLKVIWGERADAIAQEACDILGVKELRDYFAEKRSGGKFFKDHLSRYSKSRRQAPIYWPLSTDSGSYTLWIYYHRLTADTLYTAITRFIEPKQVEAAKTFAHLNAKLDRSKAEDKELETAQLLVAELATFRDSLLEIAKFWKPNLNDGVQITAAPLWKHFRLPAWQNKLKETWISLEKGEYDWAHLAHSIWPARVIPKCITDRSLAIAHGHEAALWEEVENDKGKLVWQPKKDAAAIAEGLVRKQLL